MTIGIGGNNTVGNGYENSYTSGAVSTTTGSTFIAWIVSGTAYGAGTFSDSKSNSYTQEVTDLAIQTTYRYLNVWVCQNGTGSASHTFTAALGGGASNYISGGFVEITGAASASLDKITQMAANGTGPSSPVAGASVSTTSANELIFAIYGSSYGPETFTGAGTSWTIPAGASVTDSGNSQQMVWAYRVVSSTGSYNPSWSMTGTLGYNYSGVTMSFIAAGGSGTTITPSVGALTLTGVAPLQTLTLPSPGTGALTLSGKAPTVSIITHAHITPSAGALTLAGIGPTLKLGTKLIPSKGALTLTGVAPTLKLANFIKPSTGSLTLSGKAPTVSVTSGTTISPHTAALGLSGQAPRLGFRITALSGALTLAGKAPQIGTAGKIQPSTGALTLTGRAPTVVATGNAVIQPQTGHLTLTGFSPQLSGPTLILPRSGALTMTGYAPVVVNSGAPPVGTGAGDAPTRRMRFRVVVDGEVFFYATRAEADAAYQQFLAKDRARQQQITAPTTVSARRIKVKPTAPTAKTPRAAPAAQIPALPALPAPSLQARTPAALTRAKPKQKPFRPIQPDAHKLLLPKPPPKPPAPVDPVTAALARLNAGQEDMQHLLAQTLAQLHAQIRERDDMDMVRAISNQVRKERLALLAALHQRLRR